MSKRIAIQGYRGSFHELAANKLFGKHPKELIFCKTFIDVFSSLDNGLANYALAAIGNNRYGDFNHVYEILVNNHLSEKSRKYYIAGEVYLNISHCLLGVKGAKVSDIKTVYSQAPAIVQCFGYLHSKLKDSVAVELEDTALSAQMVSELGSGTAAAIASKRSAKIFGLEVLADGIQDDPNNISRFILLSLDKPKASRSDSKTSMVLSTNHKAGDLVKALGTIADNSINLSYIQSMPIPNRPFEYRFYIDLDGGLHSKSVQAAIKGLDKLGYEHILLGSYKKAAPPKLF